MQIVLHDPEGREILRGDGQVQIGEPPAGVMEVEAGAVLAFDVPLEKPGTYAFDITVDGAHATSVPVAVSQMPAQTSQAPPGIH